MKAIKICLVFFFLAGQLFLSSCDNRKDYFITVNKAPTITLVKNGVQLTGNSLTDSLKIGEPLSLHYFISDEEKLRIQITHEQQQSTVDIGSELISFTGVTEGQAQVTLMAIDSFNEEAKFSISFTVFRNITPTGRLNSSSARGSKIYNLEI